MEKRLMTFIACLFLSIGMALAQTQVSGPVTSSEDGSPVIGASIKVVGTNTGTVTNIDGNFSLNVSANAKLEVSYIGMVTKTVKAAENMKIVLDPDNKSLSEVIVTGYGSARKLGTIAGSVATVSGKALENRPIANLGDAMQGQVAGLQVFTSSGEPSATTSMRIRGVTSIYATTDPLFILDGSEISQNTFLSLNPNDVESMTVLKDASSTAIYGSRAANGVVIITSKRGKFGEAPTVTVSAQYGVSKMTGDNAEMMNANEWLNFQEILNPDLKNSTNFQAEKAYYQKYNIGTDWSKKLFGGSAPISQVDVSVRGGSQSTSYLVSFSHYKADGIMDDSSMRRETLRANIETKINPWLKIGANTALAYDKTLTSAYGSSQNSPANKVFAARTFIPIQPYYEVKGLAYDASGAIDWANSTFEGFGDRLNVLDMVGGYNPYYLSERQPSSANRVRINENAFVNISPIKGLNIRSAIGLDANDLRQTQHNYQTDDISFLAQAGYRGETFSRFYRWTVTNTAEYKFNVAKQHDFSILLGQESMSNKTERFGIMAGGLTDNRLTLLSAAPISKIDNLSQAVSEEVRNSWFGMLNYSFADRYFLDLSLRRDGSSLFAKDHRWATFGAAAFMWNVTKEEFMKNTRGWLNDLQFKISYGSTGNSGIDPYMALGLVGMGPMYNGQAGTAVMNPSNPELTWETVKTFNLTLAGKMFNRFNFDVEYYDKRTSNMLMTVPYSYTTGFSEGWGNVAAMYNKGLDFTFGVDIIKNKDWYWTVSINGNYNKNKITKLLNNADSYDVSNLVHLEKGHAFGEHYRVRWSHVDPRDGQNVWLDKNGNETKVYSDSYKVETGKNKVAPWSGGLNTTLAWKGIQLDAQFTGMFGRYMLNNERWFTENPRFATDTNQSKRMFNMWQKPGDVTDIAAADASYQLGDDRLVENASFVRLKMLQLSYTLPATILKTTHFIKDAKIYFVGRNLLTITSYKGYDPEVDSFKSIGNYPNTRQYSIGVQLTF